MREMKDSGIEWIGEMPNHWEMISFWQAIKRMGTGLNPRDNFELTKDDPFFYVTIRNFKDGVLYLDDDCDRISKEAWEIIQERSQLQEGDILFASISKDGQAYIIDKHPNNWNINESVFTIRLNDKYYYTKYFYYHLINDAYYQDLRMDATGSTFQSIKQNKLRKSRLILPPLSEQKAIADFLDRRCAKIDAVIEQTKATIEEYKKLKQSVITEAVTKGIRGDRPMKDSGIEWIGEICEKYSIYRLKHLLQKPLMYGANESGVPFDESLPRYIRITDITLDGKLKDFGKLSLTEESASEYILEDNDVLFARSGATVGKAFIYRSEYGKSAFAGYLIKASVNQSVLADYLFLYTQSSLYEEWKKQIFVQATIQNIGADRYSNLPIVLPSIKEQHEIVSYLDQKCAEIDTLIEKKTALLAEMETYKKSLIFEYVTGKKEVV